LDADISNAAKQQMLIQSLSVVYQQARILNQGGSYHALTIFKVSFLHLQLLLSKEKSAELPDRERGVI
jgi:hypothetical protein